MSIKNFGDKQTSEGFNKNPENINKKGRPKRLVSHINDELKAEGFEPVTQGQVRDAYLTIINLPFNKIKAMATTESENFPALYKLVAKQMIGKRSLEMLDKLLDRAIGKPTQSIDHTTKGDKISVQLSSDDAKL